MPLLVNLRHVEVHDLHLSGELSPDELAIDTRDEVIQSVQPLIYDFQVQKLETSLLLQGSLGIVLHCQCVRCLKSFDFQLNLRPWTCHLPLEGEEALQVNSDCVDLTPAIREDILLEFPQHPLCDPECGGLTKAISVKPGLISVSERRVRQSAWDELNKLKF